MVRACMRACKEISEAGCVVHACNLSSIQRAEAGGSPEVSGQPKYVSPSYSQPVSERETKLRTRMKALNGGGKCLVLSS